jgi:methyl-accepting chemotaxis protein
VAEIEHIRKIIYQINDIQHAIAKAVQEQTATTNEIGRSVAGAAQGSSSIKENITSVAESAQSTRAGAGDTQKAAAELSQMAIELQGLVERFHFDREHTNRTRSQKPKSNSTGRSAALAVIGSHR